MRNYLWASIFFLTLLIGSTQTVFSESSYVLPYPSFMPGSKMYKIHLVYEKIMQYWNFGSFGQFTYNLKQSDKYLVEAKTLFEYRQYLLGDSSLKKSDSYFKNIYPELLRARKEKKDTREKEKLLKWASLKHIEELEFMERIVPERFVWKPEKGFSTILNLKQEVNDSIQLRKHFCLCKEKNLFYD